MPATLTDSDTARQPRETDFPSYLSTSAPIGALKQVRNDLGSYFNTAGLENSYKTFNQSMLDRGLSSNAMAARAAQNRAQISGGRVGSSFAQGSANQALYGQMASNLLDMNRQRAALLAQKGQLAANIASDITGAKQRQQGMLSDYDIRNQGLGIQRQGVDIQRQNLELDRQRMEQQNSQFQQSLGLQRSQLGLQALPYMQNGSGLSYDLTMGGAPATSYDAMKMNEAQSQQSAYQSMLQNVLNGIWG